MGLGDRNRGLLLIGQFGVLDAIAVYLLGGVLEGDRPSTLNDRSSDVCRDTGVLGVRNSKARLRYQLIVRAMRLDRC